MISKILVTLNWSLKIPSIPEHNKFNIFECGFQPFNSPRTTFSLPYFIITLIFLIFDVEIRLIFPFLIPIPINENYLFTLILIIFIILLILGFLLEWINNAIEWIKL